MFGSPYVKYISGEWYHYGVMTTEELPIPDGVTLTKGTWLNPKNGTDDTIAQLASGVALGFATQDMDNEGHTSLQAFQDVSIGKQDIPIKKGQAMTVRVPNTNSRLEFEGAGAAVPGNLVCTSGTGAIASNTAKDTELSFLNGCIRKAQTGDIVQLLLETAALTAENPNDGDANVRIRVRVVGGYVK